jgi:hypothetical protein
MVREAYSLYEYYGSLEYMTWEHSNNDGALHRWYLRHKYNLKSSIGSKAFASLLLREHRLGLPRWQGLVIKHANDNHLSAKTFSNIDYNEFWIKTHYEPFRDSLTSEQKERMTNV